LESCEVVPADPTSNSETLGIVEAAAAEMERYLVSRHPVIVGLGTGRALRAVAEQISPMDARSTRSSPSSETLLRMVRPRCSKCRHVWETVWVLHITLCRFP
jgi:Putative sugar-binding domain